MMPVDYGSMLGRIAELERQVAALATATRPNQQLSTGSYVEFMEMLSGTRGTWVPVFSGSTTAGVYTYTFQDGYYFEISNIVYFFALIGISAIGTPPVGVMRITGLPFPSNASYAGSVTFGRITQFNYTAAALALTGLINAGGQLISLWESFDNAGVVAVPAGNFTNVNTQFFFTGMYMGA